MPRVDVKTQRLFTQLIDSKDVDGIRRLLSQGKGLDVDFTFANGLPPLLKAIAIDNATIFEALVRFGASVDRTFSVLDWHSKPVSALEIAIIKGALPLVQLCLAHTTLTPDKLSCFGVPILVHAVIAARIDLFDVFIEHGVDPSAPFDGIDPIDYCFTHLPKLEPFATRLARLGLRVKDTLSIDASALTPHKVRWLARHQRSTVDDFEFISRVCCESHVECVVALVDEGIFVHPWHAHSSVQRNACECVAEYLVTIFETSTLNTSFDSSGYLLVHRAILRGSRNLLCMLCAKGCEFPADRAGMTCHEIACMTQKTPFAMWLRALQRRRREKSMA